LVPTEHIPPHLLYADEASIGTRSYPAPRRWLSWNWQRPGRITVPPFFRSNKLGDPLDRPTPLPRTRSREEGAPSYGTRSRLG
jgi:hypothetical protein